MENTIDNQFNTSAALPPERPQFLSVLCILTWIACGLMFISTLWGVLFQPSEEEQYEQIEKIREMSPEAADQMEIALQSQNPTTRLINTGINLAGIAMSAFGAWFMWQLRRKGFYIYLAGETIPYAGFLLGGGEALSAMGAMTGMENIAGIAVGIMVVLDIVFVAMYAMHLKYMRY